MKSTKLLVLLATLALAACDAPGKESSTEDISSQSPEATSSIEVTTSFENTTSSSSEAVDSSQTINVTSYTSSSSIASSSSTTVSSSEEKLSSVISSSSEKTSSSEKSYSSAASSSSSTSSSRQEQSSAVSTSSSTANENEYKINFVNPTCGTMSTEVLNDRLASYINEQAGFTLVTGVVNTACQIQTGFPTDGNSILIIGSAKAAGSLRFNFASNAQAITIKAQTYHKPYTDGSGYHANVDTNSILCITAGSTREVDLKPVDGQPVEKEFTEAIQSKTVTLSSKNDTKGRVFIKEITFTL